MRASTWTVLSLTILAAFPRAGAAEFGAHVDYWRSDLSGTAKAESASIPATRLSFSQLGMDTSENIPSFELFARFGDTGRHRVSVRYWEQSYSGQTTLTQSVTFKTFTFPVSTQLNSEVSFRDVDLRYAYDFWQGQEVQPRHRNAVWGIFGLKALTLDSTLSAQSVGTASEGETAPLPVLGLGGRVGLCDSFSLEAQIAGLALDVSDVRASFYEFSLLGRWDCTQNVALELGWRRWHLGAHIDSTTKVDVDATVEGPWLGLEGRF